MSVLTNQQLIKQLAELLLVSPEEAERIFGTTVGLFRNTLLDGHQLDLKDFLSLQVVEEKARIVQLPDSTTRLIEPPRNTLVTKPLQAFESQLAQVRLAPILLVVPQNDFFAQIIEYHFAQAGWPVQLAHDPYKVGNELSVGDTHLVIVDVTLPGAYDLIAKLKLRRATNAAPTIAICPRSHDPESATRLRVRPDQEIIEPFEVAELLACAERELLRAAEEELLFEQQVQLILPGTQADLDRATALMRDLLGTSGLDEAGQTSFLAAVREGIGNAVQHGSHFDSTKTVHIQYLLDRERITLIVRDEGHGFDFARFLQRARERDAVAAARERHAEGGRGGLGILMMVRAADRVEYSTRGNVVTLSKFLRPKHTQQQPQHHPQPQAIPQPQPEPEPQPQAVAVVHDDAIELDEEHYLEPIDDTAI